MRQRWRLYRECIDTFLADERNILANIPAYEHSHGFIKFGNANRGVGQLFSVAQSVKLKNALIMKM